MGVASGSKLCYQLGGLTFSDLCSLARKRAESVDCTGFPAVAFDMSWLAYNCHHSSAAETIYHVMAMLLKFLDENFIIYPVFDPPDGCQHHSKKASIACEFQWSSMPY